MDFTGRYIKVLDDSGKDHYNGLKKGMYLKFHSTEGGFQYWGATSQLAGIPYYFGSAVHLNPDFELMPEGFNPNDKKSLTPTYVKCIEGKSEHYITGTIYPVKNGRVEPESSSYIKGDGRTRWDNKDSSKSSFEPSTLVDFLEQVKSLNISNNEIIEEVFYVRCISWSGYSHIEGKIYPVFDGKIQCEDVPGATPTLFDTAKRNFNFSTKEAYDLQFLHKNVKTPELKDAEYVKCIIPMDSTLYSGAILGRIYKVQNYTNEHFSLVGEKNGCVHKDRFEVASKEAFDLQNSIMSGEKEVMKNPETNLYNNFSIGEWIYVLKSDKIIHPVGSIRKVVYAERANYEGNLPLQVTEDIPGIDDIQWINDARHLTYQEFVDFTTKPNLSQNLSTESNINQRQSTSQLLEKLKRKTV